MPRLRERKPPVSRVQFAILLAIDSGICERAKILRELDALELRYSENSLMNRLQIMVQSGLIASADRESLETLPDSFGLTEFGSKQLAESEPFYEFVG